MQQTSRRAGWSRPAALAVALTLVAAAVVLPGSRDALGQAALPHGHPTLQTTGVVLEDGTEATRLVRVAAGAVPESGQDPCLHCHVHGEDTAITTEPLRWALLVTAGMVFAFGMFQSATVWRTRRPWVPLRVRAVRWLDERYAFTEPLAKALGKPVPAFAMRWWYCLGGITAFLFVVQAFTGIMLAFYYKPTPEAAYQSILYIQEEVRFGGAVRTVHQWAANGMIVLCLLHMVRTFIVGAYKRPRELNWVSGALLLVLTLAFGFTGYLLPWDQRAYWATTVGTEIGGAIPVIGELMMVMMRVGWDVGAATLSRFYALHVIVLPVVTIAAMGAHFLMVRRLGLARPL